MQKEAKLITLVVLLITIGQCVDIYLPSLPHIAEALHTSYSLTQITISVAMITFGLVLLIYGPLSDYFGRRKIALFGMTVFLIGTVICIISFSIEMLLIGRAIQGLGIGCAGAVAPSSLRDVFSDHKLIKAISYVSMAYTITPVIAPVIGGYLQSYFNWRAPFVFLLIYALIIYSIYFFHFTETNPYIKKHKLTFEKIFSDYLFVIRNKEYLGYLFCFLLVFSGEISYVMSAPFLYQVKLGLTPIQNGWLMIFTVAGLFLGTFFTNKFCVYFSSKKILLFGAFILIMASLIMTCFVRLQHLSVLTILFPMMLFMFGAGIIYPNVISGCVSLFPEKAGVASAVMSAAQIGGAGILTVFFARFHLKTQLPLALFLLIISICVLSFYMFFIKPSSQYAKNAAETV